MKPELQTLPNFIEGAEVFKPAQVIVANVTAGFLIAAGVSAVARVRGAAAPRE